MTYRTGPRLPAALSVLALTGTLAVASPARAQVAARPLSGVHVPGSMGIPQPEPKITLSVRQRLNRILAEMRKQVPYEFRVLADLGVTVFDLDVKQVPLSTALRTLMDQDRSAEPLVFSFTRPSNAAQGYFTIQREIIDTAAVDGQSRISVANGRLTKVLPEIFTKMGVKDRIEPDVPPILISLQLRPENWAQAFQQAMLIGFQQEPGLAYSLEGDTYVAHLHKTPLGVTPTGGVASDARRVSISANQTPLRDVLAELFKGSQWKDQVSDNVKDTKVTYMSQAEPELLGLQSVLRKASLTSGQQVTYREGRGVLYIEPGALPGEFVLAKNSPVRGRTATLAFSAPTPLLEVVQYLQTNTGATIRIAPNVPNTVRVVVKGDRLTAEQALAMIVESGRTTFPNLAYKSTGENQFTVDLSGSK